MFVTSEPLVPPTLAEPERRPKDPLVTVVIPARNEESSIGACLESVLRQDLRDLQVVVVDGNSHDLTATIVQSFKAGDPRIEVIRDNAASIPRSLNLALRAARGRWLVRVDAHSTVPPDYVRKAVEHLSSGRWGGVGGRKEAMGFSPAGRAIAAVLGSRLGVGRSVYHYGNRRRLVDHIPFGAYPLELLQELGGWDERVLANEDFELDQRVRRRGHDLLFDPELEISWRCQQSVIKLFRQYRRYGRGKASVVLLHPGSLKARHLAPALFVALVILGAAVPRRGTLLPSVVVPYGIFVAAASAILTRRLDEPAGRAWIPAVFASMHAGYGLGFLEGMIAAPLSRAWRHATRTSQEGDDRGHPGPSTEQRLHP